MEKPRSKYPLSRTNHQEAQRFHYTPAPIRVHRSDKDQTNASLKDIYSGTRTVLSESTHKTPAKKPTTAK